MNRIALILFLSLSAAPARAGTGTASENDAGAVASVRGQPCYKILYVWGSAREAAHLCKGVSRDDPFVRGQDALFLGAIECIEKIGAENAAQMTATGIRFIMDATDRLGESAVCTVYYP